MIAFGDVRPGDVIRIAERAHQEPGCEPEVFLWSSPFTVAACEPDVSTNGSPFVLLRKKSSGFLLMVGAYYAAGAMPCPRATTSRTA